MAYESIQTRADLKRFLEVDLIAYGLSRWHWSLRLARPQLQYQRLLRRVEYWSRQEGLGKFPFVLLRLRLARESQRLGISIPPGVFGPGLSLPHYGTIIVNDKARFGKFCRLHASTNIGESQGHAPHGGDFVYIAPGAVLYGQIVIGDGAAIGANSVVSKDVPANSTVAGAPARVVREVGGSRLIVPSYIADQMP
jgi:serine O-acetyltransferase